MCEKKTFDSFDEAQKFLSTFKSGRTKHRKSATKKPKRAYKCEFCGFYHVTSMKKKQKRK